MLALEHSKFSIFLNLGSFGAGVWCVCVSQKAPLHLYKGLIRSMAGMRTMQFLVA